MPDINYFFNLWWCSDCYLSTVINVWFQNNGQQVAIKVFSDRNSRQIIQARLREADLLKSIDHKNVMQLLASESEVGKTPLNLTRWLKFFKMTLFGTSLKCETALWFVDMYSVWKY